MTLLPMSFDELHRLCLKMAERDQGVTIPELVALILENPDYQKKIIATQVETDVRYMLTLGEHTGLLVGQYRASKPGQRGKPPKAYKLNKIQ